jgi:hypothetical protein
MPDFAEEDARRFCIGVAAVAVAADVAQLVGGAVPICPSAATARKRTASG